MPFRHATALVTLEREGVTSHRVMQLHGKDPSFTLKVDGAWAPNLYVSVLVLRGRVFDVPWYSFFTWGWRQPGEWWSAYRRGDQDQPQLHAAATCLPATGIAMRSLLSLCSTQLRTRVSTKTVTK